MIFDKVDIDGSGGLDYSEWQIATINKRSILQEEKLLGAFKLFDKVRQLHHHINFL
jgi:calcium-dependent protein kinase